MASGSGARVRRAGRVRRVTRCGTTPSSTALRDGATVDGGVRNRGPAVDDGDRPERSNPSVGSTPHVRAQQPQLPGGSAACWLCALAGRRSAPAAPRRRPGRRRRLRDATPGPSCRLGEVQFWSASHLGRGTDRGDEVVLHEVRVDRDRGPGSGTGRRDPWARGSTALPAAQTPATLVRPAASTTTKPASSTWQPTRVSNGRPMASSRAG